MLRYWRPRRPLLMMTIMALLSFHEQEVQPPSNIIVNSATCYTRQWSHFGTTWNMCERHVKGMN